MELRAFYSWQSDLDKKINRNFIQDCIKFATKQVNVKLLENSSSKEVILDEATRGTKGSVDIPSTLFEKIDIASIFICDISIVENSTLRKFPNPNVLIELGYAASEIGWENIVMIFNESKDKIEELPFDIRSRRVLRYNLSSITEPEAKKTEKDRLKTELTTILYDQSMIANPLMDSPIVKTLIYIWNKISNVSRSWGIFISDMSKTAEIEEPKTITFEHIEKCALKIDPNSKPNLGHSIEYENWYQYIAHLSSNTNKKIMEIFLFQNELDLELTDLLTKAEAQVSNSNLYEINKHVYGNKEFSFLAYNIYDIQLYLKAALARFKESYSEEQKEYFRQYREQRKKLEE